MDKDGRNCIGDYSNSSEGMILSDTTDMIQNCMNAAGLWNHWNQLPQLEATADTNAAVKCPSDKKSNLLKQRRHRKYFEEIQDARNELLALENGCHPVFNNKVKKMNENLYKSVSALNRQRRTEIMNIEEIASKEMNDILKEYRTEAEKLRETVIEGLHFEKRRISRWKAKWKSHVPIEGAEYIEYLPERTLRSNKSLLQDNMFLQLYNPSSEYHTPKITSECHQYWMSKCSKCTLLDNAETRYADLLQIFEQKMIPRNRFTEEEYRCAY